MYASVWHWRYKGEQPSQSLGWGWGTHGINADASKELAGGLCLPSPRERDSSLGCNEHLHSERGSSECSQTRRGIALVKQKQVSGVFLKKLEIPNQICPHGYLPQSSPFPLSLFISSIDVQRNPLEQKSQLGERERERSWNWLRASGIMGCYGGWSIFNFCAKGKDKRGRGVGVTEVWGDVEWGGAGGGGGWRYRCGDVCHLGASQSTFLTAQKTKVDTPKAIKHFNLQQLF